jgi:purine-nucleoside phosphorylase
VAQGYRTAQGLAAEGLTVHRGRVWSIDAPYRETVRKVVRYRQEGILGVDMETSALFTVARYRGIDLACVLVVSDDLSTLQWVHGFKDPRFLEARKRVARCVLQTLEAVGENGK